MHNHRDIYCGGTFVPSESADSIDVIHAANESVIGRVPAGTVGDVDKAVTAARQAFGSWSQSTGEDRAALLHALSDGLRARSEELGELIAAEVGMPLKLATMIQAGLPASVAKSYAKIAVNLPQEETLGSSLIVREPVGVVGCITPWNYPLHQIVLKVAAAIAAGCTVVVKPSEVAPLNAYVLAQVMHDIKAPAGVFNLVSGYGEPVGEALACHPQVDLISFTGSTRAGRRVAALAAASIKRVTLELGGKSASIVFDGDNFERAIKKSVSNCYLNAGQTCSAWTRLLVPKDRHDDAAQIAKQAAEKFGVGDPMAADTRLGPLVSATQRDRVREYIRLGQSEGASLVTGGPEAPAGLDTGFYVKPTVFAHVDNSMRIAREEIFGPVLCIISFEDEDDAIRIANDSDYGLGGAVWSQDEEQAKRVALRLRTGQVDINGAAFNPKAPFGGYKQSGYGREGGRFGLEEFLQIKSLQI